ncbi:hypothetical protein Tco_0295288 [Tanacetum coccineum]
MITCPNFTATSLERYLSDHRPILLRESHFDYGPTPFRFFHSWFEMEGFNKLVEDAWNEAPVDESNAMSNMMKKLKYLKQKIRDWNKGGLAFFMRQRKGGLGVSSMYALNRSLHVQMGRGGSLLNYIPYGRGLSRQDPWRRWEMAEQVKLLSRRIEGLVDERLQPAPRLEWSLLRTQTELALRDEEDEFEADDAFSQQGSFPSSNFSKGEQTTSLCKTECNLQRSFLHHNDPLILAVAKARDGLGEVKSKLHMEVVCLSDANV